MRNHIWKYCSLSLHFIFASFRRVESSYNDETKDLGHFDVLQNAPSSYADFIYKLYFSLFPYTEKNDVLTSALRV